MVFSKIWDWIKNNVITWSKTFWILLTKGRSGLGQSTEELKTQIEVFRKFNNLPEDKKDAIIDELKKKNNKGKK